VPIGQDKRNCPALFGHQDGKIAEPAVGFNFGLHLLVGNPRDASYVKPLVDTVEQAIARIATSPRPAIHSLVGDLALSDMALRGALRQRGMLTIGLPNTVDPLTPSPSVESRMVSLLCRGAGRLSYKDYRGAMLQTGMAIMVYNAAT
jgi:hypothetical protein